MSKNYISPNYKGERYYALPQIDLFLNDAEWLMFTVLFNHLMTKTKHDTIKAKPIEVSHQWLSDRVGKSEKQSQRLIKALEKLEIIRVFRYLRKPNKYMINWDGINRLAIRQLEEDKNVGSEEDIDVPWIEDTYVSNMEDIYVSQIIKTNKKKNKYKNKEDYKSAGTTIETDRVSATELGGIVEMVLSSSNEAMLAKARNRNPKTQKSKVANPHLAASTNTPIEGIEAHTARQNPNLQSSVAATAAPLPLVPLVPLSPREEKVIKYCDKYYNNGSMFTMGELEAVNNYLYRLLECEGEEYSDVTISKIETTYQYLDDGINRGYFL